MSNQADPLRIRPGQIVRRRSGGTAWGLVVGVIFAERMEALVRWRGDRESTFELVDGLVDAIQFLL